MTTGTALTVLLAACGGDAPVVVPSASATGAPAQPDPRSLLAARVAVAKDQRYIAAYSLVLAGKAPRSVLVTVANDKTWRVDVQGGALGGTADVSIANRPEGVYQCAINPSNGCVRVGASNRRLPVTIDPRVQYVFVAWLDVLLDRQVSLSVSPAQPLAGTSAPCFAVEPGVTAVQPPIDAGVYCYDDRGMLAAAKLPFGQLTLTGDPAAAPETVTLPGPVVAGQPMATSAPPPPPPSPTVSASRSPSVVASR